MRKTCAGGSAGVTPGRREDKLWFNIMPGGDRDSSKTRVAPAFERLATRSDDWIRALLSLPSHGAGTDVPVSLDLTFVEGYWGALERGLAPPVSLLSWLIRNLEPPVGTTTIDNNRERLLRREPKAVESALNLLKSRAVDREWWIFEGPTYPDAFIETRGALIVVEGKRTESGPTTCTTWMPNRHQMWRHMDAAWEIRGNRAVFGLFIVDAANGTTVIPPRWQLAATETLSPAAVAGSFPHRGDAEREAILQGFLGVTTWQSVCDRFGIDRDLLPETVHDLRL